MEKDILIEKINETGVQITHKPTHITIKSNHFDNYEQNYQKALRELAASLYSIGYDF